MLIIFYFNHNSYVFKNNRIKKEAEARNEAEGLILTTENDYLSNEVVPEESKEKIRQGIADLRKALETKQDIAGEVQKLKEITMAVGADIYAKAQQQQQPQQHTHSDDPDQQQRKQWEKLVVIHNTFFSYLFGLDKKSRLGFFVFQQKKK